MTYSTVSINTPPPYLTLACNEKLPTVLSIAGTDPSGGAGIEADVKTITAHRCYAMTCITALNAQTPVKVYSINNTPKEVVFQTLESNLKDMKCNVIKTGMLTAAAIEVLHEKLLQLGENRPKLVVDPVLVATSGSSLAGKDIVSLITEKVAPFADILTPNIPECYKLLGEERKVNGLQDIFQIAKDLAKITKCSNILVKGGHIPWNDEKEKYITDVLFLGAEQKFIIFKGNFVNTTHTHGTGCTLASAIASNLARGYSLPQSVYGVLNTSKMPWQLVVMSQKKLSRIMDQLIMFTPWKFHWRKCSVMNVLLHQMLYLKSRSKVLLTKSQAVISMNT